MDDDSESEPISPPRKRFLDLLSPETGDAHDVLFTQEAVADGASRPVGEIRLTPRIFVRRQTNAGLVLENDEVPGLSQTSSAIVRYSF